MLIVRKPIIETPVIQVENKFIPKHRYTMHPL